MSHKLIVQLKQLVKTERKITAEIIEVIKEIDRLKLYLGHGHTSMFSFLTKEMGYTPTSAIRRINAARILLEIPQLKENLKAGAINLSQASMVVEAVRQKQKAEPQNRISKEVKQDLLLKVQSLDLVMTEKVIAQNLDLEIKAREKKHFQKDESIRLEVTLTKRQWDDLQRVKELISHQNVNPNVSDLIGFLTESYLDKKDPLRRKVTSAPDALARHSQNMKELNKSKGLEKRGSESVNNNRYISQKIRRTIFQRDQCCQWMDVKTSKKCGSKFQMQVDHIQSKWLGGNNEVGNLQLLCAVHNKLKYQKEI